MLQGKRESPIPQDLSGIPRLLNLAGVGNVAFPKGNEVFPRGNESQIKCASLRRWGMSFFPWRMRRSGFVESIPPRWRLRKSGE